MKLDFSLPSLRNSRQGCSMSDPVLDDLVLKLKEAISTRSKTSIPDEGHKRAAVLIPFYAQEGTIYIVFTRRTELVSYHKGEISFPGGGVHATDHSLLETALRESEEEIGLKSQDVVVLGELDDMLTRGSNFVVTPFVGLIPPGYGFSLSSFETAEILKVPIPALLLEGCRQEEPQIILGGRPVCQYVYTYRGQRIIGATARILKQFLEIYLLIRGL
jgi:8-oxo-dGTP pyrophosphatase MutT (NUDIX family)